MWVYRYLERLQAYLGQLHLQWRRRGHKYRVRDGVCPGGLEEADGGQGAAEGVAGEEVLEQAGLGGVPHPSLWPAPLPLRTSSRRPPIKRDGPGVAWMSTRCWLCEFSKGPEAHKLTCFLVENAGKMGVAQIAAAIHESLHFMDPSAEGISEEEITDHITNHTLLPAVRVAHIMRGLLDLTERLGRVLHTTDEEGNTVVSARSVNMYLKVVNEVMAMYRAGDVNKLLFADPAYKVAYDRQE